MPLPYPSMPNFSDGPPALAAADLNKILANINYLASMINSEIQISAGAMEPSQTNGASPSKAEMTTNKNNYRFMNFVNGAQSYAEFGFRLPSDYNGGTITYIPIWTANSSSTNSVIWGLQLVAIADDEALDAAFGAAVEVTDANKSAVHKLNIGPTSGAVTIAGTPAAGEWVSGRIYRKGSGADTLAVPARLMDLILTYTRT